MGSRRTILAAAMAVGLAAAAAWGDVVHLRNGTTLRGTVEEEGTSVRVTTAVGVVTLQKAEVLRIERTASAAEVYEEKRKALPPDDADAAFALAEWCKARGLREEHLALVRRTLSIDRRHRGALEALRRILIAAPLAPEPKRADALKEEFGPAFTVKETAHYLLVYNTTESYANGRAALLERLCRSFYGYFHDGDFALMPLTGRLVVVIFASREEFARYSGAKIPDARAAGGFFHTASNRSVFFATYSDDKVRQARSEMSALRTRIAADARSASKLRRALQDAQRRRDHKRAREMQAALDRAARRKAQLDRVEVSLQRVINMRVSLVLHEATHQLVFNTRLLRNPAGDPRWLHEGFAMLFESARDGQWRGLGTPNVTRLAAYQQFRKTGQLPALKDLLVEQDAFMKPVKQTPAHYASAWALLYYLSDRHRPELNAYLKAVARHKPGPVSAEARLKDFIEAFGPLADLEPDWHAFMGRVKA